MEPIIPSRCCISKQRIREKRASCSREEGIKFHRNAREEERCLKEDRKGTLRTKISWLSTACTAVYCLFERREGDVEKYKFDLFQVQVWKNSRDKTELFSICFQSMIVRYFERIEYSIESIDPDIVKNVRFMEKFHVSKIVWIRWSINDRFYPICIPLIPR